MMKNITLITDEDKKVWHDFVSSIEKKYEAHDNEQLKNLGKVKSKRYIKVPEKPSINNIKSSVDLHGLTIETAYFIVYEFLEISYRLGKKQVHIITGIGKEDNEETLNKLVPKWLKEKPFKNIISSFSFMERNKGDLIVSLKTSKKASR